MHFTPQKHKSDKVGALYNPNYMDGALFNPNYIDPRRSGEAQGDGAAGVSTNYGIHKQRSPYDDGQPGPAILA